MATKRKTHLRKFRRPRRAIRRRALGDPPEVHKGRYDKISESILDLAAIVKQEASRGACGAAFEQLQTMERLVGQRQAESRGAGWGSAGAMWQAESAEDKFKKACVVR